VPWMVAADAVTGQRISIAGSSVSRFGVFQPRTRAKTEEIAGVCQGHRFGGFDVWCWWTRRRLQIAPGYMRIPVSAQTDEVLWCGFG